MPDISICLSDHEVSQGYQEDTPDPSVYVKFNVKDESLFEIGHPPGMPLNDKAFIVAWTTTPWTLPGNTALAVNEDVEYGIFKHEDEFLLFAADRGEDVLGAGAKPIVKLPGKALAGLNYEALYRPEDVGSRVLRFDADGRLNPLPDGASTDAARRVVAAEYVSVDDGTGVVHIAPAFGAEDFDEGKKFGLLFAQPLDLRGIMADGLPGAGQFAKDADKSVIADLEGRGQMLRTETIKHTYPFCWRCSTPLLYYAKPSWYIRTTKQKDALLEGNNRINWYPEHIRSGRFGNWLDNNIDWAFSRERYWGSPLPFWVCPDCGSEACVGSRAELAERAIDRRAAEAIDDLHRPYIDDILLRCDDCGGEMKRVPEVADAWFDSGAMPYAQWHFPFENEDEFLKHYPADFICEAIDQTRGWFYTLHAEATLLKAAEGVPEGISNRNVICLGHIQDEKGNKMSKSRGNSVEPWSVINELGADAVRWYMYTASPAGSSRRFSSALVEENLRRFLLTLWNTYSFFVSYANIDGIDPRKAPQGETPELDRWLLSELNALVVKVTDELEAYDPTDAGRAIEAFVVDLSNWYVRRSRRRFWRGVSESDDDKRSAYYTLYTALVTLSKLLAPFTPFVAEELWQNLVLSLDKDAPESVHLAEWPGADTSLIDSDLNEETQLVKRVCSLGRAARAQAQIKVRQPVAQILIKTGSAKQAESLRRDSQLVLEELNAKELITLEDEASVVTYSVKPNLPALGPRFGAQVGAIRKALGDMDAVDVAAAVRAGNPPEVAGHTLEAGDFLLEATPAAGYAVAEDAGYTVAVTTELTSELLSEGIAREVVRRIQDLRRESEFELSDRIVTTYAAGDSVSAALVTHVDYVSDETLSTSLTAGAPTDGHNTATFRLDGDDVTIGVRKDA